MTSPERLEPRRHPAPPGWPAAVFECLTSALAAALVAVERRERERVEVPPEGLGR